MIYKFYDTCSLLLAANHLFENPEEKVVISSITLQELENIKTAANKDGDVKNSARNATRILNDHDNDYELIMYNPSFLILYPELQDFELSNDIKIISCALMAKGVHPNLIFYTNDLCCKNIARTMLDNVQSIGEENLDDYDGYKEVYLNPEEMADFYQNLNLNNLDLLTNEYLIIHDATTEEIVDSLCWTGEEFRHIKYGTFISKYFGEVKPMKNDVYQALAADSLQANKITMIKGPAGTGKTYLSLGFLLHKLEKNKIDKILIFCNTVATKNSAKLGYYPGTRDEKLLDSQIGNLLISKIGGRVEVERMIEEEKLVLLPLSDIRGYDTSGMRAGIYISEAQNLDIDLMKLTLQRIGEDSICIIDGDCKTQVDDIHFAGINNGMRKASQVFRGEDVYGEVTLKQIHRSRIAQIAEKM